MTYNKVYESLVATGLKRIESASEAAYRDAWNERVVPLDSDPLAMAIAGATRCFAARPGDQATR